MPPLRHGSTAANTTTNTARGTKAKRRHEGQAGPGGGSGRVVGERARPVARPLGRAAALGAPPGGKVNHVVKLVRSAEPCALSLVSVPRPLEASGLGAAGVLNAQQKASELGGGGDGGELEVVSRRSNPNPEVNYSHGPAKVRYSLLRGPRLMW